MVKDLFKTKDAIKIVNDKKYLFLQVRKKWKQRLSLDNQITPVPEKKSIDTKKSNNDLDKTGVGVFGGNDTVAGRKKRDFSSLVLEPIFGSKRTLLKSVPRETERD